MGERSCAMQSLQQKWSSMVGTPKFIQLKWDVEDLWRHLSSDCWKNWESMVRLWERPSEKSHRSQIEVASGFGSSGMTRAGPQVKQHKSLKNAYLSTFQPAADSFNRVNFRSMGHKLRTDHPATGHPWESCIVLKGWITQWCKGTLLMMCHVPNWSEMVPWPRFTSQ